MKQFKEGDWVLLLEKRIHQIKAISKDDSKLFLDTQESPQSDNWWKISQCGLWQPKQGEWCWFYDTTSSAVPILAQFDYMSDHIYITTEIQIPFSGEEFSAYGFNSCIPFIGQLPKILKD